MSLSPFTTGSSFHSLVRTINTHDSSTSLSGSASVSLNAPKHSPALQNKRWGLLRLNSSFCWSLGHPQMLGGGSHMGMSIQITPVARHRKSRSRRSPQWGQGPAACLWSNAQTAVTDCLVYTGPRENHSRDGDTEASRSL